MKKVMLMMCLVAGILAADDRSEILDGVKLINAQQGTLPGSVLCVKEEAFPLVAGNADGALMPVASAARYGRGKIVAVGHPSFYSANSLKLADTAKFVRNALQWLGGGQIGIYSYKEAEGGISTLDGLAIKVVNSLDEIKDCQVLVVYPDSMKKAEDLEVLRQFILDGGGVLSAGIGWGWKQITGKNLQTDNFFNKLFGPAGLLTDDSFVNRPNSDGYPVADELPEELNVAKALAFAKDMDAKLKLVNKTLTTARAVMADDGSDLAKDFDALIARGNRGAPTLERPWRTVDLVKRLAAVDFTKKWQANLLGEYKAHPGARNYPGMPPKDSPRLAEKIVTIDLSVPRWHSTGVFAVAGEPLTVTIPEGQNGLRLRIGTTTCNNTRHDHWERMPRVDMEIPLEQTTTTVTSPFGGLVYIIVPAEKAAPKTPAGSTMDGKIDVTFKNGCAAVWYVVGRDNLDDWKRMLAECPAPRGEIESDKVILAVKKEDLLAIQDKNPDDLMKVWATVADLDATLTDIPLVRKSPERFCMDDQLCAGYMHAGYPIMLPSHTAKELLDADFLRTKGDWGFFHEIGHNHQNYDWTFDGTGEVTVNFFTLYVMEKMCGFKPRETRMTIKQGEDLVKRWKEKGQTYQQWKSDPFLALEMFVRLQVAYGWEPFEKMFKEYRTLADAERPKNDDQKRDQWVIRFSKFTNANIASVFDAWKVPISEEARKACANYPAANEAIFAGLR